MTPSDVKYLKEVQKKINSASEQLSNYASIIQATSNDGHSTNEDALLMLAEIISDMDARITELEGKING